MLANTATPSPLKAIRGSLDRISLEKEFKRHKISSKKRKIDLMMKAMRISAVSYSQGYPSIEERYNAIVETYLSGVWKQNYSSWKQGE